MNEDKYEADAELFEGNLKEDFGRSTNDEAEKREGTLERITDEFPEEDLEVPKHKLSGALEDASDNRRRRPPARIL